MSDYTILFQIDGEWAAHSITVGRFTDRLPLQFGGGMEVQPNFLQGKLFELDSSLVSAFSLKVIGAGSTLPLEFSGSMESRTGYMASISGTLGFILNSDIIASTRPEANWAGTIGIELDGSMSAQEVDYAQWTGTLPIVLSGEIKVVGSCNDALAYDPDKAH